MILALPKYMKESDRDALIVMVSSVVIGLSLYSFSLAETVAPFSEVHQISTEDNSLKLHTGCHELEMYTSEGQLNAIETGLQEVDTVRPTTHQLTESLIEGSGSNVDTVEIYGFEDGAYLSEVVLENGERVDARPSDGVALAVEANSSIRIDRGLLHQQGEFFCDHYL